MTDSYSGAIHQVPVRGKARIAPRDDRLLPVVRGNSHGGVYVLGGRLDQLAQGSDEFWLRRW